MKQSRPEQRWRLRFCCALGYAMSQIDCPAVPRPAGSHGGRAEAGVAARRLPQSLGPSSGCCIPSHKPQLLLILDRTSTSISSQSPRDSCSARMAKADCKSSRLCWRLITHAANPPTAACAHAPSSTPVGAHLFFIRSPRISPFALCGDVQCVLSCAGADAGLASDMNVSGSEYVPLRAVSSPYDVIPFSGDGGPPGDVNTRCLWVRHLDKV